MKGSTMRTRTKAFAVVGVGLLAGAGIAMATTAHWAPGPSPAGLGAVTVVAQWRMPEPSPTNPTTGALEAAPTDEATPASARTYRLTDGHAVPLTVDAPLPVEVVADLEATATTSLLATAGTGTSAAARTALAGALEKYDTAQSVQTGRSAVVVYATSGVSTADSRDTTPGWSFWGRDNAGSYTSAPATKEATVAAAQAWIAKRDNPTTFQLVVTTTP